MTFLKRNPFIAIAIPTILGIYVSDIYAFRTSLLIAISISTFLYFIVSYVIHAKNRDYPFLIFLTTSFLSIGIFLGSNNKAVPLNDLLHEESWTKAYLVNNPTEKAKSFSATINIAFKKGSDHCSKHKEKIIVYFEKSTEAAQLKAGDEILAFVNSQALSPNLNRVGFDYAKYMQQKKVYQSTYLKTEDWTKLENAPFNLLCKALNIRKSIVEIYKKAGLKDEGLAVFSALTIGYKNELDPEIKQAYAGSGAIHILAVSGMHVGIILSILHFFIHYVLQIKNKGALYHALLIIGIWIYALISGLTPSITRATIMGTFVLTGKLFGKHINVYNSITASAFFMLCYNPAYLYDLGFQLSYTALLGILLLHKKIANLISIPWKPLQNLWELTALALSAQLGTLPISLLYFNQLPTYFWLSGALVVLFAYLLMVLSIILMLLNPILHDISHFGSIIQWFTDGMNSFIFWIYQLPKSTLLFYQMNTLQSLLLYVSLGSILLYIYYYKHKWLLVTLTILLITLSINIQAYYYKQSQTILAAYYIPKETLLQFSNKGETIWLCSDVDHYKVKRLIKDISNSQYLNRNKQHFILLDEDYTVENLGFCKKGNFIFFQNKKILITNPLIQKSKNLPSSIPFDYHYDASKKRIKLLRSNPRTNQNYHSLEENGVFLIKIKDKANNYKTMLH